jgi:hypothetical protein
MIKEALLFHKEIYLKVLNQKRMINHIETLMILKLKIKLY